MNADWFAPRRWPLANGRSLILGPSAIIMGVLNVTPDSFSDGGDFVAVDDALARARTMMAEGATIIDIGGESTRPGAASVDGETERARVLHIIERLARDTDAIISVDTYRAETARAAVEAGAHIVNDIWGCQREPDIARVAADTGAGLVVMNNRRERAVDDDLIADAISFLNRTLEITDEAGVSREAVTIDPGFGFSPTIDHDVPILARVEKLHALGLPILIGTSRKRFLGALTDREAADRDVATAATSVVARMKGAAIFRVHGIGANKDALAVADAVIADTIKN
ncbi:dihydropteroate synthase [Pseudahrensia aquimaris]|uniref:Dihydropteroate synthase n=1 Tax=Pseudahrensia aquimaris TaxID=744461 RepID=A0ABW3FGB8_9HYPH